VNVVTSLPQSTVITIDQQTKMDSLFQSSRRGQVRSTSLPPTASSSTASSSDVLNDSTASNISFASSNVSNDAEGEPNTEEELLIHEKKSTVEEKTVKRVPRE
jgi:hypothetical protein